MSRPKYLPIQLKRWQSRCNRIYFALVAAMQNEHVKYVEHDLVYIEPELQ